MTPPVRPGARGHPVFLGLDLGTTGVRVVAVTLEGEIVAAVTRGYPLLTPRPGWTEQRPSDWLSAVAAALREMVTRLGRRRIAALGLSGQMHGLVALDRAGTVIRPAILWNDQRTGEAVAAIEAAIPRDELIRRTGNRAATGFQLPKLIWLRSQEPVAFARVATVLLPKDFVAHGLTGELATEPSDASGSGCFDLTTRRWAPEILDAVGLDIRWFPPIVASTDIVGRVTGAATEWCALPAGTPVVAGAGDNAAAATGLGVSNRRPRRGSVSLGTSGVIFAPLSTPTPDPEGRVHLFCHADGQYHLLGVTLAAAGSLQWFRDTLAPGRAFDDLLALAGESPPGAHGVTFLPYLAGERTPYMDPALRGAWTGLSLATGQGDLVRSLLEGVAFSLRDVLDLVRPLSNVNALLATGGGARSDLWLRMVGDVLETPLVRPRRDEGAAYGAALLAMLGTGGVATLDHLFPAGDEGAGRITPGGAAPYAEALRRYRASSARTSGESRAAKPGVE